MASNEASSISICPTTADYVECEGEMLARMGEVPTACATEMQTDRMVAAAVAAMEDVYKEGIINSTYPDVDQNVIDCPTTWLSSGGAPIANLLLATAAAVGAANLLAWR